MGVCLIYIDGPPTNKPYGVEFWLSLSCNVACVYFMGIIG